MVILEYKDGVLDAICAQLGTDFKLDPQTGLELLTGSVRDRGSRVASGYNFLSLVSKRLSLPLKTSSFKNFVGREIQT